MKEIERRNPTDGMVIPGPVKPVSVNEIHHENFFGLEGYDTDMDGYGKEVFRNALMTLLHYADTDKDTFLQLRDTDRNVVLPAVQTGRMTAQLELRTEPDGANVISLTREPLSYSQERHGFYLIQSQNGNVAVVGAEQNKTWTSKDDEYKDIVDTTESCINEYFKQLDMLKSATVLNAETSHELRETLGKISILGQQIDRPVWMGQRLLRKATRRSTQ